MEYFRSKRTPIREVEEPKEMRVRDIEIGESILEDHEYHDMIEPQESVEKFLDKDSHKRKPSCQHGSSYKKLKGMSLQREYIERERGKIPTVAMWP